MPRNERHPIPDDWMLSEGQFLRLLHADVENLSSEQLWGERVELTNLLAERHNGRVRDGLIYIGTGAAPMPESQWLHERITVLDREFQRRGAL